MDVISRTIHLPIWFDHYRIYVPSVDVPFGRWTVMLSLVPIRDAWSEMNPVERELKIVNVDFSNSSVNLVSDPSAALLEGLNLYQPQVDESGQRLILQFDNTLTSKGRPLPARYTITVGGFRDGKDKGYDPVVIAQPDPIYP